VADALFQRCKNELNPNHVTPALDQSLTNWKLKSLHPRIRFVCYTKGQNFPPHFDDPFVQNDNVRSFFTFIIYLSKCGSEKAANFDGGEFAFLARRKEDEGYIYDDIIKIKPEPGLVVVFHIKHFMKANHS